VDQAEAEEGISLATVSAPYDSAVDKSPGELGCNFWRDIYILPERGGRREATIKWHVVSASRCALPGHFDLGLSCTCPMAAGGTHVLGATCGHIQFIRDKYSDLSLTARAAMIRAMSNHASGSPEVIQLSITGLEDPAAFHPGQSRRFVATYAAYSPYHGTSEIVTGGVQ
jgi:hypothetical protein